MPKVTLEGERLATVETPFPERLTDWGLPAALSVTARAAPRLPAAAGVKVTLMVQFEPAAKARPQLLVWAKSLAFTPKTATLERFKGALPVLVRVTAWAALETPTD